MQASRSTWSPIRTTLPISTIHLATRIPRPSSNENWISLRTRVQGKRRLHGPMMMTADITAAFDRIRQEMARIDPAAPLTPADQEFARFAQLYRHGSDAEKAAIMALAPLKDSPLFWALTSRAAELALWDADPIHLEDALAGHCIEDFKADPRENLMRLALIWYAAEQLKISADQLFADAAKLASPKARQFLIEFSGRPKAQKTLKAMGSEAVEEDGRIRFRPLPPPWRRAKAEQPKGSTRPRRDGKS